MSIVKYTFLYFGGVSGGMLEFFFFNLYFFFFFKFLLVLFHLTAIDCLVLY